MAKAGGGIDSTPLLPAIPWCCGLLEAIIRMVLVIRSKILITLGRQCSHHPAAQPAQRQPIYPVLDKGRELAMARSGTAEVESEMVLSVYPARCRWRCMLADATAVGVLWANGEQS